MYTPARQLLLEGIPDPNSAACIRQGSGEFVLSVFIVLVYGVRCGAATKPGRFTAPIFAIGAWKSGRSLWAVNGRHLVGRAMFGDSLLNPPIAEF